LAVLVARGGVIDVVADGFKRWFFFLSLLLLYFLLCFWCWWKGVKRYKARLLAKGYRQKHEIDYEEVFALVARLETIRLIIATVAQHKWIIYKMDVKSTFF
jgi:uncharacterized membrane protein YbaN (DUF454 family)